MAKKVTINGDNILHGLEDDWGGVNETKMTVNVHDTPVGPGCEWGVNRGEIERFIKEMFGKRVGCLKIAQDDQNTNVVLGFKDNDDWETWNALSDGDKWGEAGMALIVSQTALPSEGGNTYTVLMSLQAMPQETQPTTDVTLKVKGSSYVLYATGGRKPVRRDPDSYQPRFFLGEQKECRHHI